MKQENDPSAVPDPRGGEASAAKEDREDEPCAAGDEEEEEEVDGVEDDFGPAFFAEADECAALLARAESALPPDWSATVPPAAADPAGAAAALERLERVAARYQESPHLLHAHLEALLGPLVQMLRQRLPAAADVWRMEANENEENAQNTASGREAQPALGQNYDEYDADAAKTAMHQVSRAIYVIVKTAGEKCCTSYFPNDVKLYEDVFYALRWWQRSAARRREWEMRYCLLLWLSNLVLVPFSLAIIDSAASTAGVSLSDAVLETAIAFLSDTSKCRDGAALLVARLLTRPDGDAHRQRFFAFAQTTITNVGVESVMLHGVLMALAKTLKFGQRRELAPYAPQLIPCVAEVIERRGTDALVCKTAVKVQQRLVLTMLKSRSAPWRYQRHVAMLDHNLACGSGRIETTNITVAHKDGVNGGTSDEIKVKDEKVSNGPNDNDNDNNGTEKNEEETSKKKVEVEVEEEEEEEDNILECDDGLEDAIGQLLGALGHKDTVVRWSAAKGVARICDRLPREMAQDVIAAVFCAFENENADCSWHGGLLAVAELCRRSILHPRRLDQVVPFITKGLAFDLSKGTYSVGSHVRDAACYTCWSLARAYDAADLEPHVHRLSSALVVASLFDREVHVRRAAAAAFQECVGRLGTFPDGIRLVTTMDFFSLASLQNAYLRVAPRVAENAAYRGPLIEELVAVKLSHWDRRVRCAAARALGLLCALEPCDTNTDTNTEANTGTDTNTETGTGTSTGIRGLIGALLPVLIARATDGRSVAAARHGAVLGVAELVAALDSSVWAPCDVAAIAALAPRMDAARLFRSRGGEFVRQACCRLVAAAAQRQLPLPEMIEVPRVAGGVARVRTLAKLQEFFEDTWRQILEWLQRDAADAYEAFAAAYFTHYSAAFHGKIVEKMFDGAAAERGPMERRGNLLALGALPWALLSAYSDGTTAEPLFARVLRVTTAAILPEECKESRDAEARRNAVRATRKVLERIPPAELRAECCGGVLRHVLAALDDYAADRRGDVGSFVRMEAVDALPAVVACGCAALSARHTTATTDTNINTIITATTDTTTVPPASIIDADTFGFDGTGASAALAAARALLKQAMEKLDRLRGPSLRAAGAVLATPAGRALCAAEPDAAALCDWLVANAASDWAAPQFVFASLAGSMLRAPLFSSSVAEGLAVSAGALSQHVMVPAVEAFVTAFRVSPSDAAALSGVLVAAAAKYVHNERVVVPLCATIDRMLIAGVLDEARHMDIVEILRSELKHFAANIHALLPLVGVLGDLCRSAVREAREAAWRLSLVMLVSRFPKVRAKMGTDMYTALLVYSAGGGSGEDCGAAMAHLTATQWDAGDATKVRAARDVMYELLGITRPVREGNGDAAAAEAQKQKGNRVVAGSYLHLVHEAGY